jgi:hypothetical protein
MTIIPTISNPKISVTAEVVGVYQKDEKPVTTFLIRPFTIETDDINEARLGDEAAIEISISINSINFQPMFGRQL